MNIKKLLILLAAGLAAVLTLAACNDKNTEETETVTDSTTESAAEAETAIPRYDYFAADVSADVTISETDYKGLTLTISDAWKIEEEDVDAYIQSILFENRTAENGSTQVTDAAMKLGDDAFIYYKGFMDGKEFDGGSNWDSESPYQLGLGSGAFIPGFEDALVGVIPAEATKESPTEIQVTFPEDYGNELAGREAVFQVAVLYAVQYKLPEYNRAFVEETLKYEPQKDFYASDRALLDEFEDYVLDSLIEDYASNVENAKLDALWSHLIEVGTYQNLPEMELNYYINSYKEEAEYYFDYYTSMNNAEFNALYPELSSFAVVYFGLDVEAAQWEDGIRGLAEKMVKKDMVSHAIGEMEGLESVTDEEYQAEIDYWVSAYYGYMTADDIVQNMGEIILRRSAYDIKITEWLLEQITFTYEDGSAIQEVAAS